MAQVDESLVVRRVEFLIQWQADQRPGLAAEVVGNLGNVDQTFAGLEYAVVMLVEKIGNPVEYGAGELGLQHGVDQGLFQAAQHVVVIEWRHVAAPDNPGLAGSCRGVRHGGVIEPVGGRPRVGIEIARRPGPGKRPGCLFRVGPALMSNPLSPNTPEINGFPVRHFRQRRADVVGADAGNAVNLKFRPDVCIVTEMVAQFGPHFIRCPNVCRDAINRFTVDGGEHSFP